MNQIVSLPSSRQLPANLEAEQSLLAAIFRNNRAYENVSEFLLPEHFSSVVHGEIYRECSKLIEQGHQANPVTLNTFANTNEVVRQAGGHKCVVAIAANFMTGANTADYGKLIYDLFLRREVIALGESMVNDAFNASAAAREQIEGTEERLFALAADKDEKHTIAFGDAVQETVELSEAAYKADGTLVGITTGLRDLDRKLGGLHKGDLLILAGRPGMGKTALATTMAVNTAKAGNVVAFFSLEMSHTQLATRILAHEAGLDSHRIRNGQLSGADWMKLHAAQERISSLPIHINPQSSPNVSQIRTACRRIARKGIGLVVIDYLQLIASTRAFGEQNRVQEVSAITRALKALARDLNIPVLALSQLSRAVEHRDDKRPQLSDLRESGSIEQDADVVMFAFREEYYLQDREPDQSDGKKWSEWKQKIDRTRNMAEVNVAKQRHGSVGPVQLHFNAPTTWFSDLARDRA